MSTSEDWKQRALDAEAELKKYRQSAESGESDSSSDAADEKEEVFSIMRADDCEKPLVLYKYISLEALKGLLVHRDFKVTYRHDANDPFEMVPSGSLPMEQKEHISHDGTSGFVSFTKNANDPAMWGNYAGKYTGARIKFEIPYFHLSDEELIQLISRGKMDRKTLIAASISLYSKLEAMTGIEKYNYKFALGEDFHYPYQIIKCVYSNNRYQSDPNISVLRKQFSDAINQCVSDGKVDFSKMGFSQLLQTTEIAKDTVQSVAVKHTTWENENEYRSIIPEFLISRKEMAGKIMFFTSEFSEYITTITLAPDCPISEAEANILLSHYELENNVKCQDITVNRARYNRTSFLLDIPGEYQDGLQIPPLVSIMLPQSSSAPTVPTLPSVATLMNCLCGEEKTETDDESA